MVFYKQFYPIFHLCPKLLGFFFGIVILKNKLNVHGGLFGDYPTAVEIEENGIVKQHGGHNFFGVYRKRFAHTGVNGQGRFKTKKSLAYPIV